MLRISWLAMVFCLVARAGSAQAAPLPVSEMPNLKFSVTAEIIDPAAVPGNLKWLLQKCTTETAGSIDCVVLHTLTRNAGPHPVFVAHMSCSDSSMWPQQKVGADWVSLKSRGWVCTMNVMIWDRIDPGKTLERDTLLRYAGAGVDINTVRQAGDYELRLLYSPLVCVTGIEANRCLTKPETPAPVPSNPVHVHTTKTLPEQRDIF